MYLGFLLINRKYKFILLNLFCIILFAILYYVNNYISNYNKTEIKINSFYYYLWHSLVTQTTVGYANLLNNKGEKIIILHGEHINYLIINMSQLLSIILITALFI